METFFSDALYLTKVFLVSSILTVIFFLLLLTRKIYKKKLSNTNLSIYSSLFLLLITLSSFLIEKGFDPLFGARPLKRLLQDEVLNPLSEVILDIGDNIQDKVIFSKDKFGLTIANKNLKVLKS